MRPSDASVVIRPRSKWEALDLGTLLARRHAFLLMSSWALVTLPIFGLLVLLLWDYPSLVVFIFWWLKPAFERLPLYILSNALFGATPTLTQTLKRFPKLVRPQLIASLTWRRLSLTRSFALPVLQLEGLTGKDRTKRLDVLYRSKSTQTASWLTIVGAHLELVLWAGTLSLLYMFLPSQMELEHEWTSVIGEGLDEWLWLHHLTNLFYAFALIIWAPVYVACGFTLYLNRRTELEAWDIELLFRQLAQRLRGIASALFLGGLIWLLQVPQPAFAAEETSCPIPFVDPNGPLSDRLLSQPLTSKAAQDDIRELLDNPPFSNKQTVQLWRLKNESKEAAEEEEKPKRQEAPKAADSLEMLGLFQTLATLLKSLLWAIVIGLVVWLLWHYREWLGTFVSRLKPDIEPEAGPPKQLFGLDLTPQSLPSDIATAAEQLWDENPRAALGLLYRGLLSNLLHKYNLPLKVSHTEAEVLGLVDTLSEAGLQTFSHELTQHWQNLAYGHRLPAPESKSGLCSAWRRLFTPGTAA